MNASSLDQCRALLDGRPPLVSGVDPSPEPLAITLSREAGAGAITIANILAATLPGRTPRPGPPWIVVDRQLVAQILADDDLPTRLEEALSAEAAERVHDILEDLYRLRPPIDTLADDTNRTILRLAMLGNVILIGRGGNFITASLDHVLHVRLIAPWKARLRQIEIAYHLGPRQAVSYLKRTDRARARYVRWNFRDDIRDPHHYDLTIDTARTGFPLAAEIIGTAALGLGSRVPVA